MTDLELIRKAAAGDAGAFHALIDRHAQDLFGLAYSMVGRRQDAEDILQETLAGAFQGMARFEGRAAVRTWLTQILVRQVARWRRERQSRPDRQAPVRLEAPEAQAGGSALSFAPESGQVDHRLDLDTALAGLSPEHREVIVLREMRGLAYEEIAELLEVPRGTVESRLHRARQELKRRLKAYLP